MPSLSYFSEGEGSPSIEQYRGKLIWMFFAVVFADLALPLFFMEMVIS